MFKRLFLSSFLILAMVSFTGCPLLGQKAENTDAPAEDVATDEGDEENPGSEEQQLFNAGPKALMENYRPVSAVLPEGLKLEGTLYVPGLSPYKPKTEEELAEEEEEAAAAEEEGAAKPKPVKPAKIQYPLIVMMHMLSGDRWEWKDYPVHLVKAGYAVLVYDLRGHGDSVYQGKRLRVWRQFDRSDWQKMPEDARYLLAEIAKNPELNMVNTRSIGIIGSSIGANSAVNYAAKHPNQVRAMVLLSPGLDYKGIEAFNPLTHYENAVYFVASKEDAYASDSVERLYKFALGKKKIKIFQDLGHGTDMLINDTSLGKDIIAWLKGILPPPAVASDEPASEAAATESKDDEAATKSKGDKTDSEGVDKSAKDKANEKDKPNADSATKADKNKVKKETSAKVEPKKKPVAPKPAATKTEETKPSLPAADATKPVEPAVPTPEPVTLPSPAPAPAPVAPPPPAPAAPVPSTPVPANP